MEQNGGGLFFQMRILPTFVREDQVHRYSWRSRRRKYPLNIMDKKCLVPREDNQLHMNVCFKTDRQLISEPASLITPMGSLGRPPSSAKKTVLIERITRWFPHFIDNAPPR